MLRRCAFRRHTRGAPLWGRCFPCRGDCCNCRRHGRGCCHRRRLAQQLELDPAVGLAPFFGAVIRDRLILAIALGDKNLDRDAPALQGGQHGFGAGLAQRTVAAFRALAVGVSGDFHFQRRAFGQHFGQRIQNAPRIGINFGRAGGEGDLLAGQNRVQIGGTFFRRRQGGLRVELLIIADVDLEGFALSQLARQDLRHPRAAIGRSSDARHLHQIGLHRQRAVMQHAQRLDPGQNPDRPALGQPGFFLPGRGIDTVHPEMRARKAVNGIALQRIRQAPAQFDLPGLIQLGGELHRALRRGGFLGRQGRGQREDRRKLRLQIAHHAVKHRLRGVHPRQQGHIRVREGDRPGSQRHDRLDPGLGGLGPTRGWHAQPDGAGRLARHTGKAACLQDPISRAVTIGGTGVKPRAPVIAHKAQGEGRQHGAGGRDINLRGQPLRHLAGQIAFQLALFLGAGGNRRDRHQIRRHRNLGPGQQLERLQPEGQRRLPAPRGRIIGGFQHVGHLHALRNRFHKACQLGLNLAARHQPDQRNPVVIAQHFNREPGRIDRADRGHIHAVANPRRLHHRSHQIDGAKTLRLIGGGAAKLDLKAIRLNRGPCDPVFQQA